MAFKSPQPLHHSLLQRAGCSQGWAPAEHLCAYAFIALFFPWFSEGRKATVSISFLPPLENLSSFPFSGVKYNTERCGGGQGLKNEGFGLTMIATPYLLLDPSHSCPFLLSPLEYSGPSNFMHETDFSQTSIKLNPLPTHKPNLSFLSVLIQDRKRHVSSNLNLGRR